jgi:hypothetical protein
VDTYNVDDLQSSRTVKNCVRGSIRIPPVVEGEAPFQNIYSFGTNKNVVVSPDGARTSEGQQQITVLASVTVSL